MYIDNTKQVYTERDLADAMYKGWNLGTRHCSDELLDAEFLIFKSNLKSHVENTYTTASDGLSDIIIEKEFFIGRGFKELGNKSGTYQIKVGSDIYKVFLIQKPWTINNWLTIEMAQGTNKFLRYNGFIYSREDFEFIFNLIFVKTQIIK